MLNIASGKARERRGRPAMLEQTRFAPGHGRHSASSHREDGERGPARGRGHGEATGHGEGRELEETDEAEGPTARARARACQPDGHRVNTMMPRALVIQTVSGRWGIHQIASTSKGIRKRTHEMTEAC
jgi:hypothetical protein